MTTHIARHGLLPYELTRGKGIYMYDAAGKRYLDAIGGWCTGTVGWSNPDIAKVVSTQVKQQFFTTADVRSRQQDALAKTLITLAPGKINRVFRVTSGSEAVEMAIKAARATTGKRGIISFGESYHGHTFGAMSIGNGISKKIEPGLRNVHHVRIPKTAALAKQTLQDIEQLLQRGDIAGLISEPVWTNAGVYIPPASFFKKVQALCRKYKALLVMDEVATNVGRCGTMFASELWGLQPDIITMGKGVTGGYATLGATLVTERVFQACQGVPHYSTFAWRLTDVVATQENLRLVKQHKLVQNAARIGKYLLHELQQLTHNKLVTEVRGIGMVFGIELATPTAELVAKHCFENGLLVDVADNNIVFISPHLCTNTQQAKAIVTILAKSLL